MNAESNKSLKMPGKTIDKFIEDTFIREIGSLQQGKGKFVYLSFGLIAQGIESLGSLIDKYEIQKGGESRERFDNALINFLPDKYDQFTGKKDEPKEGISLYKELRCGLLHVAIPKSKVVLGENKNKGDKEHLEIYTFDDGTEDGQRKLFVNAEDFYEDFKSACETVVKN